MDLERRVRTALLVTLVLGMSGTVAKAEETGAPLPDDIKVKQDAIEEVLNGFLGDKAAQAPIPPPAAKPPPSSGPAPAPVTFAQVLRNANTENLDRVGELIAARVAQTHDEKEKQALLNVGAQLASEFERREKEPPPPQSLPKLKFPDEGPAFKQLKRAAGVSGTLPSGDVGPNLDPIAEIGRSAFGEGGGTAGVQLAPQGTQFFNIPFRRMDEPSPYRPALPSRVSDLKTPPPPPPKAGPPKPVAEKGVRIAFDPVALAMACRRRPLLAQLEQRLLSRGDTDDALAWADEQVNALALSGPSRVLGAVTVLSLRNLCRAAAPYKDRWDRLPEELRRPAGLRRIHGFALAPDGSDVLLLGTAEGTGDPVDIDDLVVGFGAVWRDAQTPICSLDPRPHDIGGPQQAIILGIPRPTRFARIMLDADYRMKRILLGDCPPQVDGFRSLKDAADRMMGGGADLESARLLAFMARFWFTPVPPGPGEVHLSPDDRVALFDAAVQVSTEEMQVVGGTLTGAGTRNPLVERTVREFSRRMGEFESRFPEFRALRALFDIAEAAALLRRLAPASPVLAELCGLPTRRADVPDEYAGVSVAVGKEGVTLFHFRGGVMMTPSLTPRSLVRVRDPAMERVRQQLAGADWTARRLEGAGLRVAAPAGGEEDRTVTDVLGAERFAASGRTREALRILDGLLADGTPTPDLLQRRCRVLAQRGCPRLAERDLDAAEAAGADPRHVAALRLQLKLERSAIADPGALAPADRARLADLYLAEAVQQGGAGCLARVLQTLDRIRLLRAETKDAVILRIETLANLMKYEDALAELAAALPRFQDDPALHAERAALLLRMGRGGDAEADASRVIERRPDSVRAWIVRATARLGRVPPDTAGAYADLKAAQKLDAANPMIHALKSDLLRTEGDRDGAMAAAREAIRLAPGMADARIARATLLAPAVFPDEGGGSINLSSPETVLTLLQDLNLILEARDTAWNQRMLRAGLLLGFAKSLGQVNLDWEKFLPLIMPACLQSPPAMEAFIGLQGVPSTPEEAKALLVRMGTAFVWGAIADMERAWQTAPPPMQPAIHRQLESLRKAVLPGGNPP